MKAIGAAFIAAIFAVGTMLGSAASCKATGANTPIFYPPDADAQAPDTGAPGY